MLNKVILIGRITKDPELKQAGDKYCCNFTLAVNRRFAKEGQQDSDFISCVTWGQSANFMSTYIKKGYLLSVEGRLQTRSYDGQIGKVYVTEVLCESVNNLTPKQSNQPQPQPQSQKPVYQEQNFLDAPRKEDTFEDSFMETPFSLELEPDDLPFY